MASLTFDLEPLLGTDAQLGKSLVVLTDCLLSKLFPARA